MPKRTPNVEKRINTEKDKLINQLSIMPIISVACTQCNIARATYYRWCADDGDFKRRSQKSIKHGVNLINDIAESNVLNGIKQKDSTYTRFWLVHRHPEFNTPKKIEKPDREKDFEIPAWLSKANN